MFHKKSDLEYVWLNSPKFVTRKPFYIPLMKKEMSHPEKCVIQTETGKARFGSEFESWSANITTANDPVARQTWLAIKMWIRCTIVQRPVIHKSRISQWERKGVWASTPFFMWQSHVKQNVTHSWVFSHTLKYGWRRNSSEVFNVDQIWLILKQIKWYQELYRPSFSKDCFVNASQNLFWPKQQEKLWKKKILPCGSWRWHPSKDRCGMDGEGGNGAYL